MLEIHHVEAEQLKSAYDHLYVERPIRHSDSFYLWILDLLQPVPGSSFLDIACGQGRLVELAEARGLRAYGSDLSFQAVQVSSLKRRLLVSNGEALPCRDRSLDYLTNIGSLEHYANPPIGVREMARVLKPGGLACILLPNVFGLFSTILYSFHNGRIADDGQPIQRYAARLEWQDLLEANGLKILRTVKYECEWPRSTQDWIGYLKRPKSLVRLALTPLLPLNLANSFVYLCKRKATSSHDPTG